MQHFKIILDTRTIKKNGKFPLKLRVTDNKLVRFISLGTEYTEKEFEKIFNQSPQGILLQHKTAAMQILDKALQINNSLEKFEFLKFKTLLLSKSTNEKKKSIFLEDLFTEYIETKKSIKCISTAASYKCTINSLLKFKSPLLISDINKEFLYRYENWMIDNNDGKETATIGIYLRSLRCIINNAIQNKLVPIDYVYPFQKHLYIIPNNSKSKVTLNRNEIESIINFSDFENKDEEYARDLWLLLFYCNGINLKDLFKLKWDNRVGNSFVITREKTKRTSRSNPRPIKIPIIEKLSDLLTKIGNDKSEFVLGLIDRNSTETQLMNKKVYVGKYINKHLKKIGKKLNLPINLTTKIARDSYATSLKNSNVSISIIAEKLGHSNTSVTQHYLGSFDDDEMMKINELLP